MQVTNITISARSVYGVVRYYVDGPIGEQVNILTGHKTVNLYQIDALKRMGFNVTVVPAV